MVAGKCKVELNAKVMFFFLINSTFDMVKFVCSYPDSVETRMRNLFSRGLSTVLANITIDTLDDLDDVEVYY